MSAIEEAKAIISKLPQIDLIYLYAIPESKFNDVTHNIALLREVQVETDAEGNNGFNAIATELELQIFFKKPVDFDTEQLQVSLYQLLEQNHYEVNSFGGMVLDPDTSQLTMTVYIQKTKYLAN